MFRFQNNTADYFLLSDSLEIRKSNIHGNGVFATKLIKKREIFESCSLLIFGKNLLDDFLEIHGSRHTLLDHVMQWPNAQYALALGYGTIYNHSNNPNSLCRQIHNEKIPRVEFIAKRDIQPGEEILYHYAPKLGDLDFDATGCFFPKSGGKFDRLSEREKRGFDQ